MQCSFPAAAGSPPDRRWCNVTAVVPMFNLPSCFDQTGPRQQGEEVPLQRPQTQTSQHVQPGASTGGHQALVHAGTQGPSLYWYDEILLQMMKLIWEIEFQLCKAELTVVLGMNCGSPAVAAPLSGWCWWTGSRTTPTCTSPTPRCLCPWPPGARWAPRRRRKTGLMRTPWSITCQRAALIRSVFV